MKLLSTAAVIVADHEVLLIEILKRLPVKSLLKFKCVCTYWYDLISSPYFSNLHCQQIAIHAAISGIVLYRSSKSDLHFAFFDKNGSRITIKPLPLPSPSPSPSEGNSNYFQKPRILQSCNGLFLCSINSNSINTSRSYFIHNPTTNKSSPLSLPPDLDLTRGTILLGINLAFNPSKSPHYNVICILNSMDETISSYNYRIVIYTSETKAWRQCGDDFSSVPFDMAFTDGVFWNNTMHWISPTGATLCFDMEEERISDRMPRIPSDHRWGTRRFRYFGESGGRLYIIEVFGNRTGEFKIMEMESDYSRWFVKYTVDLSRIISAYPQIVRRCIDPHPRSPVHANGSNSYYYAFQVGCMAVIGGGKGGEEATEAVLVLRIPGRIIVYHLLDQTFWEIGSPRMKEVTGPNGTETGNVDNQYSCLEFECLDVYPYVQTLAYV